jgi:Flp pilus assembly CpaF family ATPase
MDANVLDHELLNASLNPIAPWVDDPEVTDILVYGSRNVYIRRRGGGFEGVGAKWLTDDDRPSHGTTTQFPCSYLGREAARQEPRQYHHRSLL